MEQWYCPHHPPQFDTIMLYPDKPFPVHNINHGVIEGAPMVLPVEACILRLPQGEETDMILSAPFLAEMGMQS